MTPKSRVLLAMGILAGFAVLAGVYFRGNPAPSEPGNASSMRDYYLERTVDQPPQTTEAKVAALLGISQPAVESRMLRAVARLAFTRDAETEE